MIEWLNKIERDLLMEIHEHSGPVYAVAVSPDGKWMASGSQDKTVKVVEMQTGRVKWTLSGEEKINSVAFSPDGSLIAAGDGDPFANDKTGTIRLYSTATGDPFGSPLRGHTDRVWSVCFSSDGKQLTTGSQDKTVRNWDLATRASLS